MKYKSTSTSKEMEKHLMDHSRQVKMHRRLDNRDFAFVEAEKFHKRLGRSGDSVEVTGFLRKVNRGSGYVLEMPPREFSPARELVVVSTGLEFSAVERIPVPGAMVRVSGISRRTKFGKLATKQEHSRYIEVKEIEPAHHSEWYDAPLQLDEVRTILTTKCGIEHEEHRDTLLLASLNSPVTGHVAGGVSYYLVSNTEPWKLTELANTVQAIVPPWQQGHGESKSVFLDVRSTYQHVHKATLYKRSNQELGFLVINTVRDALDKRFWTLDLPVFIEPESFTIDRKYREFDDYQREMQWTVMLHQSASQEEDILRKFSSIDKKYTSWNEQAREGLTVVRDLNQVLRSYIHDIKGRKGTFLHLVLATGRLLQGSLEDSVRKASDLYDRLLQDFDVFWYPKEEDTRARNEFIRESCRLLGINYEQVLFPQEGGKGELYDHLVTHCRKQDGNITLEEAVSTAKKLSTRWNDQNVEQLLRHGDFKEAFCEKQPGIFWAVNQ
ncbi:MAG: hypothetical protein ACFFD4_23215 [Candidatus Odinarchaeota archaeon]